MTDLFLLRTAEFSGPDSCYRDELRRVWDPSLPLLPVCMLNPSDADHLREDPTLHALMHFGRFWGFGGLLIVNLNSLRSPSPIVMMAHADPVGPENERFVRASLEYARSAGTPYLVAWGNDGVFNGRDRWFLSLVPAGVKLVCLGTTNSYAPKHPMARGRHRIPRDQQPIAW